MNMLIHEQYEGKSYQENLYIIGSYNLLRSDAREPILSYLLKKLNNTKIKTIWKGRVV
jgi:hypothetical protein